MKEIAGFVARVAIAAVAIAVIQAIAGILLAPPIEMPPAGLAYLAASWLGTAAILMAVARSSTWTGWRLAVTLGAVYYGVGSLSPTIEAAVFDVVPRAHVWRLALMGALTAALSAPVVVLVAGRFGGAPGATSPPRLGSFSAASFAALFAACSVLYVVLYFVAGTIIFPFVRSFYETIDLPTIGVVLPLQLLVRGPLHVGICVLVVALAGPTRARRALLAGAVMAGLGGFVQLVVPNPYFPDDVRWVHMAEVLTSNFLFGAITGWVFARPRR
jgi:hypothetical protein